MTFRNIEYCIVLLGHQSLITTIAFTSLLFYYYYLVLTSLALAINVDRKAMLSLAARAINEIFHHPNDIFWTGRAMDLMFTGVEIDCTSPDFASKVVCTVFAGGEVDNVEPIEGKEDFYKFSFLKNVTKSFQFIIFIYGCI